MKLEQSIQNNDNMVSVSFSGQNEQLMDLGNEWHTHEGDWVGIWRRMGDSNRFIAKWTRRRGEIVTANLSMEINDNDITIQRRNSSDDNNCYYTGTIADDGKTASGHFNCDNHDGDGGPWEATIHWVETDVGKYWIEEEMGWSGKWEKSEDDPNKFHATWTQTGHPNVTAVLKVYRHGNVVTIYRGLSSDGNDCEYTGTIGEDGKTVTGTYGCKHGGGTWSATIYFE
ncbi:hypothetical protein [Bacillus sp. ISL-45]|uniref:hypothetical protein n=1 Tax=Bacillus sp. ISL-45 TaxID=2819128 RepID=UPI001BEC2CC0|nr:hypothetical protein [Bacillus sp. ISL-45]MBT2663088.1 hypothetical protein [Bacillus sp. ISL-45]